MKGLEALNNLIDLLALNYIKMSVASKEYNYMKVEKNFNIVVKELKALEIIKEDFFAIVEFKEEKRETKTYYLISFNKGDYKVYLPKEKWDTLKEVLL